MQKEILKKIAKKIKQYNTIVIARHIGPDPDAICSQIALRDSIKETYPNKQVYAIGAGVSKFRKYGSLDKIQNETLQKPLLITVDVPNMVRVDGIENLKYADVIQIDHHPFEEDFGGMKWIEETSSSTCQMVANLILNTNLVLNEAVAENLFLGIVSDSDRFLLSYTTVETFEIVTTLLKRSKIAFAKLYEKLYERPIEEVRFHGYISDHITVTENGFAFVKISDEVIQEYKVDTATASNMINDFNFIKDVYVWTFATFDAKNEIYKVNIRSKGPIINEIASKYNGGGHKYASGVRTPNESDVDMLFHDLDETCREYKENLVTNSK